MRRIIYAIMGFSILNNAGTACIFTVFAVVERFLLQSQKYVTPLWFIYGSLNLLTDLVIWSLPLPSLFSIMHNLSFRKKVLLVLAFAVGIMSWCSTILRISFKKHVEGLGSDPGYTGPIFIVLYVTEITLAMGCVSVATYRPLVVKLTKAFNQLRGKPESTNNSQVAGFQFEASPSFVQSKSNQSRTSGSRTVVNNGGFGENIQELMEWKEVLDFEQSQFAHRACGCPYRDGCVDVELGNVISHASSCPRGPDPSLGTQIQVPAPAATHVSSSSSRTFRTINTKSACQGAHSRPSCDTPPSSESTVNLTIIDTKSTTATTPDL